jgi:hypothetical protein
MEMPLLFLLFALAAPSPASSAPQPEVRMIRLSAEGGPSGSIVRATVVSPSGTTVVTVIEGPRKGRLIVRRSQPESTTAVYEVRLDSRSAVTVTRRAGDPLLAEAAGLSMRLLEPDLNRRTVRCWIGTLAARVEPGLLTAAADIRTLKDWAGLEKLDESFLPIWILGQSEEPSTLTPKGKLKIEEGVFKGDPWDGLVRLILDDLGKP